MNIKKRLEKLEAAAKTQTAKHVITEIVLVPLGAIKGAARWCYQSGGFISVSDEELAEIRTECQTAGIAK